MVVPWQKAVAALQHAATTWWWQCRFCMAALGDCFCILGWHVDQKWRKRRHEVVVQRAEAQWAKAQREEVLVLPWEW